MDIWYLKEFKQLKVFLYFKGIPPSPPHSTSHPCITSPLAWAWAIYRGSIGALEGLCREYGKIWQSSFFGVFKSILPEIRKTGRATSSEEYSDSWGTSNFKFPLSKNSTSLHFYDFEPNGNYWESLEAFRVVSRMPTGALCSARDAYPPRLFLGCTGPQ